MNNIWIIDFGSQYTQLITKKSRAIGHSTLIITWDNFLTRIKNKEIPSCIILSGGPQSIFEDKTNYKEVFDLNIPVLGICYGMQIIGQSFGGKVERGIKGEYGDADVIHDQGVFKKIDKQFQTWMSHFDHLSEVPPGFSKILESKNGMIAGILNSEKKILGLQFHPEVEHTEFGKEILEYFYKDISGLKASWSDEIMMQKCLSEIEKVKGQNVLCAFSGGVDSLVAATMAHKVLGENLYCFFIDNGLLRPQDLHHIELLKEKTPLNIEIIDAKKEFYKALEKIDDPEKKRKAIGTSFIEIFEKQVKEFQKSHNIHFDYLLQGTLYPDVIESLSPHKKGGKSSTIKSHHNVGGLPERMNLKLIEPLRFLFKDEVRVLGEELGLEKVWVHRHPFPGPGIGVRVLGEITEPRVRKVQESDQILFEELKAQNQYDSTWQAFTVLLPVKTVGVKGDARAYEEVICLRIVNSVDGMTATWTHMPYNFLEIVSSRIVNEVSGITRVVYDITSKPPGTIEWE